MESIEFLCDIKSILNKRLFIALTEQVHFQSISTPENPLLDVIFVHGLTGDAEKTWTSTSGFWPLWIAEDNPSIAVHAIGYPASQLKKWIRKELDIFELSKLATEFLCGHRIGERPVVFVTHSLGGILTKLMLIHCNGSADDQASSLAKRTVSVIFLATPHTAPSLAGVVKSIIPKLSSPHVTALAGETTMLDNIRENYNKYARSNAHLKNIAYYEAQKIIGAIEVVSKEDANPGISGTDPVPIEADHINICKPKSRDSAVYVSVNRHIGQAIKLALMTPELSNNEINTEVGTFNEKAEYDRRDLWEKMTAADRENQYSYANNKQNIFARRYMSLGLQPGTRIDHDLLLEEIEQRFQTQIYFPLVCKNASAEEIDCAVQENIIQPLANSTIGKTVFGATQVQSALYFLTEQCHIRWDSEK